MTKRIAKPGAERDVQRRAIIWLRREGWLVINSSGAWRAAKGLVGFPDLVCHYKGLTIYVECKGHGSIETRPSQDRFTKKLSPHIRNTLNWMLVNDANFELWMKAMELAKEWANKKDRKE